MFRNIEVTLGTMKSDYKYEHENLTVRLKADEMIT